MQEVVVVGYGTVKKKDLTGSVNTLSAETLTQRNNTSPIEAMQGSMPGVQITTKTGRLGDGFDVVIRGANSLNGSKPLYVVDGVPLDAIDFLKIKQRPCFCDLLKHSISYNEFLHNIVYNNFHYYFNDKNCYDTRLKNWIIEVKNDFIILAICIILKVKNKI